ALQPPLRAAATCARARSTPAQQWQPPTSTHTRPSTFLALPKAPVREVPPQSPAPTPAVVEMPNDEQRECAPPPPRAEAAPVQPGRGRTDTPPIMTSSCLTRATGCPAQDPSVETELRHRQPPRS